jgi:hypothetical protein
VSRITTPRKEWVCVEVTCIEIDAPYREGKTYASIVKFVNVVIFTPLTAALLAPILGTTAGAAAVEAEGTVTGAVTVESGEPVSTPGDGDVSRVSRWMSEEEAATWKNRQSIPAPSEGSGIPPRTFVTKLGAPQPGGTGPVRVDFNVPTPALQPGGQPDWYAVFNDGRYVPIFDILVTKP